MSWTNGHDLLLCREILFQNPYSEKKKSVQRSAIWDNVADKLNAFHHPKFTVDKRSVRDHIAVLIKRQKRKLACEEKDTGINPEPTELDNILEQIIQLEETADVQLAELNEEKKEKLVDDKMKATDMRKKAMETVGETQKRKSEEGDQKVKRQRRNGSDTIQYLREKAEQDLQLKQEEMRLKQLQQTLEERRMEAVMETFQNQQKQQQEQQRSHQEQQQQIMNMQMMMMGQQQEQARAMMVLMEKIVHK